jgi:hypothetical protein
VVGEPRRVVGREAVALEPVARLALVQPAS